MYPPSQELAQDVFDLLAPKLPAAWASVHIELRAAATISEMQVFVKNRNGKTVGLKLPALSNALLALRKSMWNEEQGTWFTVHVDIDRGGELFFTFFYMEEPEWAGRLSWAHRPESCVRAYQEDLRLFPRPADKIPDWLAEAVGLLPVSGHANQENSEIRVSQRIPAHISTQRTNTDTPLEGLLKKSEDNFPEIPRLNVESASGAEAITWNLRKLYPGIQPLHVEYEPLQDGRYLLSSLAAYPLENYWHFVTYGLSNLAKPKGIEPEWSGMGLELSLRLWRDKEHATPPTWVPPLMWYLAHVCWIEQDRYLHGQYMELPVPLTEALGSEKTESTEQSAVLFCLDPQIQPLRTGNGRVDFLSIYGLTPDEVRWLDEDSEDPTRIWGLLETTTTFNPMLVVDLARN